MCFQAPVYRCVLGRQAFGVFLRLAWPGSLCGEYICLPPDAGCKHSGDVAPPLGCRGKRPQ